MNDEHAMMLRLKVARERIAALEPSLYVRIYSSRPYEKAIEDALAIIDQLISSLNA